MAHAYRGFALAAALSASLVLIVACTSGSDEAWIVGEDPRAVVHDGESFPVLDTSTEVEIAYDEVTACISVNIDGRSVVPLWPEGVQPSSIDGESGVEVPGFGFLADGSSAEVHGSVSDALDASEYQAAMDCWPDGRQAIVIGSVISHQ
ncbi:hypothetical protein JQS43_02065 [Natronosporangium hydrolyticum]|uniref:Uncharacterized protein n=1 Tax=Natronosporangium hydrolyticum TaxID=2811111 RepID=A0A895YCG8_9ACTN|nr:hypothetical protein [Natronosporangium hydrolyticum]QSB15181.1 hypothetical protein JQS43_02065 [Natronosporangium hydrolyticum]